MGFATGPLRKAYSAPSALADPRQFLKIWVSQFVEICIEIRWGAWVGRNSERDRISTKKRLKNASKPSIQAEIASQPIPNSIFNFFLGKRGPLIPRQTRAYDARERSPVSPVFRVPPFKLLTTSLSTDLLAGFKGHF